MVKKGRLAAAPLGNRASKRGCGAGDRLAAARALGWETIAAFVLDSDTGNLEAELIEIDENLCRAELTPAQRAAAIARRKQIWEALHPESGSICATLTGRGNVGFAADTAKAAGMTKQSITMWG